MEQGGEHHLVHPQLLPHLQLQAPVQEERGDTCGGWGRARGEGSRGKADSTGSFSCFCLSLGSRIPWGLFTQGSSYPGVFSSCIVLKHFSQMARFPLIIDFFSNCDFSRILCIDY